MFRQAPTVQPRLASDVYEQILTAIVDGQIKPGERLIQEKIAEQINISRTPVREALLRLEQEGVLQQSGRKGFSIRKISDDEVRALYGAREAIEGYAAFKIAETGTVSQLTAIQKAVDAEIDLKHRDLEEEFRINRKIHRTIVEQTGNSVLLGMFDSIWGRGISLWLFAATRISDIPPEPDVHVKLLQKIREDTPEGAQKAMIAHIQDGLAMHLNKASV